MKFCQGGVICPQYGKEISLAVHVQFDKISPMFRTIKMETFPRNKYKYLHWFTYQSIRIDKTLTFNILYFQSNTELYY